MDVEALQSQIAIEKENRKLHAQPGARMKNE